ncbi:MAG: hypothetical protein HY699_20400 [Deltaproteobacteria bacterium]|nr:hypothetical protein [Deltaproteobacteria bacterium]
MRWRTVFICAAVVTAGWLAACREYMPANRYLQRRAVSQAGLSTADARHKFTHQRHAKVLESSAATCLDCHRFDALIDSGEEELARELSAQALYPGSGACHFCHGPGAGHVGAAPSACTTCHDNLAPLRPADHDVAWSRVHAGMARANPALCESCHRQQQCIDCHERRDSIQTRMHDRNFRFIHGIEATANPMRCASCHREDFCIRCHERGNVSGAP